ncbi:unnamed protein product [Fraxinus pennsylvanica]|uniref:50S ribosomal protein L18, chloroplastic n=1 Tax=Fraxinus pennsylvanica TaxID=56036 RepID=A0AAD1Z8F6_9LAMI|nr:unnamed protein product [Fraxinus pennsylvanica]
MFVGRTFETNETLGSTKNLPLPFVISFSSIETNTLFFSIEVCSRDIGARENTRYVVREDRTARHARIRKKVEGTPERPRLCVFRSNKHIYVQVIDDSKMHTLASASTMQKPISEEFDYSSGPTIEVAKKVLLQSPVLKKELPRWLSTEGVTPIMDGLKPLWMLLGSMVCCFETVAISFT